MGIRPRGRAAGPVEVPVLNYFNYFTEIEERFQKRRGVTAAALDARLGVD